MGLQCLSKRLQKYFNRREKQTTFVVIGALRVSEKTACNMFVNMFIPSVLTCDLRERSGSVVECLTRDRRVAGSSLNGVAVLCP